MYYDRFSEDWTPDELDRDEAVERAFALGVSYELGEEHPDEYKRLVRVVGRPLVQMAFDEGRTKAKELRQDRDGGGLRADREVEFPDRDHEIWSQLILFGDGEQTELERQTRPLKQLDVPELLRGFDLSQLQGDDLSRLRLPEFLRK